MGDTKDAEHQDKVCKHYDVGWTGRSRGGTWPGGSRAGGPGLVGAERGTWP